MIQSKPERKLAPQINLTVEPESAQIDPGESVTLTWRAESCERVYLQERPGHTATLGGGTVPWGQLDEVAKQLPTEGTVKFAPKATTLYRFLGMGSGGRCSRSVLVDLRKKREGAAKPHGWYARHPDHRYRDRELARYTVECPYETMGVVTAEFDDRVRYVDQSTNLRWRINCMDCATDNFAHSRAILTEDLTQISGTRLLMMSFGTAEFRPDCPLPMQGSKSVGNVDPGEYTWTIRGEERGFVSHANASVTFLPHANFDTSGLDPALTSSADAIRDIEAALLRICNRLYNGCILNDATLDADIAAFSDGLLTRRGVNSALHEQLQNLGLITFKCLDFRDIDDWHGGFWVDYSNIIEVHWCVADTCDPYSEPYLEYVILHELLHKVGFNSGLPYTHDEIENQAHIIAARCF